MKKLNDLTLVVKLTLFLLALVALFGPRPAYAEGMTILQRLSAPVQTLSKAPTPALATGFTGAYALTFQKSGTRDRILALLPIYNWGITSMEFLGATGDLSDIDGDSGIFGAGGGVHADRVLSAMFPEIAPVFNGPLPFTGGKLTYALELGAGAGWDFTNKEPFQALYAGAGVKF